MKKRAVVTALFLAILVFLIMVFLLEWLSTGIKIFLSAAVAIIVFLIVYNFLSSLITSLKEDKNYEGIKDSNIRSWYYISRSKEI